MERPPPAPYSTALKDSVSLRIKSKKSVLLKNEEWITSVIKLSRMVKNRYELE